MAPTTMTVADLRERLDGLPDWAAVQLVTYDEGDVADVHDPHISYHAGVLTIDTA